MKYQKFLYFLQNVGRDPSTLIFEDELTGLNNRRYLLHLFKHDINWGALEKKPLCMMMIDIDYFKRINDQYGHNVGDQVLVHIAEIIENATPKNAVPIRYAGDEFLILMPNRQKADAWAIAEKLIHQVHKRVFFSQDAGTEIPLTLSIGIASAPEDAATGKGLIQQADAAMYNAKQSGRDRYSDAGSISSETVFSKTALQYLDSVGIAGRKKQLERVSGALKKVAEGGSQFVIVDGAPGMGKTSFLATIQRNLEKTKLRPIRINGVMQEAFRPYYMVSYIALALMNQLPDKGIDILERLDDEEIFRLAHILPQLKSGEAPMPENDPDKREAIFRSFTKFLAQLAGDRPLVLLIDDLHYCDPASLHLIRVLVKADDLLIFICGTASLEKQTTGESVPLDLFRTAYSDELHIEDVQLTPLSEEDIAKHMNIVFPGILLPKGLCREMASITQGNPLFIVEIIRKMISDVKIYQENQKWIVTPLEKGYFPRSLEEIIRHKMALFDEESRQFLDRASAFGESTSFSMLAGISREQSAKLYDIISQAEEQGLVRSEFEENDENVRFSSKRVRDIIYDGISPEDKKLLHHQIGTYQEKLYQQNLLPSASILAHHFQHSDDREKAEAYAQQQAEYNANIFNEQEIDQYNEEEAEELEELELEADEDAEFDETLGLGDTPISDANKPLLPHLMRALLVAVRNTKLYPKESKSVTSAVRDLLRLMERILKTDPQVSISTDKQKILVNGREIADPSFAAVADKIRELFENREIKSLTFKRNLSEAELVTLLDKIGRMDHKSVTPGFWKAFRTESRLTRIIPRQVTYTKIEQTVEADDLMLENPEESIVPDTDAVSGGGDFGLSLGASQLHKIQRVISSFLGTYSKLKLYPPKGPVASKAINQLINELHDYLSAHPPLTIARVDSTLLINGIKADTTGFDTLASGFLKVLSKARLNSITFASPVSADDVVAFFTTFFNTSSDKFDSAFWQQFARDAKVSGLFFDQRVYGIEDLYPGGVPTELELEPAPPAAPEADQTPDEPPVAEETFATEDFQQEEKNLDVELDMLPRTIRDLFLDGETEKVSKMLSQIAERYSSSDDAAKKSVLECVQAILNPKDWRPSAAYFKLTMKPVAALFNMETDAPAIDRLADSLHNCATTLILLGDYASATWIFSQLQQHSGFDGTASLETWEKPHAFGKYLSPAVIDAVTADLKSDDRQRQQDAFQLLSGMGQGILPMLINLIKREDNIRVRRMAAELLGHMDASGAEEVKQALMSESRAEDRARILDVIDSVTTDLTTELRYTLSDSKDTVRRSAFRLAERLDKPEVDDLLLELAHSPESDLAVYAINTLGKRKAAEATNVLLRIIEEEDDPDVMVAACRAMGQIGDPGFVEPLARLLFPRRRWLRRRKYPAVVRVAAAYAASQISDNRVEALLRSLINDDDARIREVAKRYQ